MPVDGPGRVRVHDCAGPHRAPQRLARRCAPDRFRCVWSGNATIGKQPVTVREKLITCGGEVDQAPQLSTKRDYLHNLRETVEQTLSNGAANAFGAGITPEGNICDAE